MIKFAETILPLIDSNVKKAIELVTKELNAFDKKFDQYYFKKMASKIGIFNFRVGDKELVNKFLEILEEHKVDFTLGFRSLNLSLKNKKSYIKNKKYH